MKILFYIDRDNFDIEKLSKYYSEGDEIAIFVTSLQDKHKWEKTYPVFYYTDLGIDAQQNFFQGLMLKSYKLTYNILDTCLNKLELQQEKQNLVKSIPSKFHRVISEVLRAEKVIEKVISFFNPQKVFIVQKKEFDFTDRINSDTNFESYVLEKKCKADEIAVSYAPYQPVSKKKHLANYYKQKLNGYKINISNLLLLLKTNPLWKDQKIQKTLSNKPIIVCYVFSHYYDRNKAIWNHFNNDEKYQYILITDWFSESQRSDLEKFKNLDYIHLKGKRPGSKKITHKSYEVVFDVLNQNFHSSLPNSVDLSAKFLTNFIFGFYDNHIRTSSEISSIIDQFSPEQVIFPSCWEVLPSMLILHCLKRGIPTLAIQAGIHPQGVTERSLTNGYLLFGDWDYQIFNKSGFTNEQLEISGWPLAEKYKLSQYKVKQEVSNKIEVLYLLAMAGSWQYYNHFPEDSIISDLINIAQQFPNINFIIRTHSGNNNLKFRQMIKTERVSNIKIDSSGTLVQALSQSTYVFSQASTAGFEAMVNNIPTFCLNLHSAKTSSPFSLLEKKYVADTKSELDKMLSSLMENSTEYLTEYEKSKSVLMKQMFRENFDYQKLYMNNY